MAPGKDWGCFFLLQRGSGAGGRRVPPTHPHFLKAIKWESGLSAVRGCNKISLRCVSCIDPSLASCSPAEPGFLLTLASSQWDMTGMKIRAEGWEDGADPPSGLPAAPVH